eukprot:TRINITY_DN17016_c0_g1_i1.p1 TRINITY_DN17016_c0_g1~~TRINITY_DN17016_c0_g1_i1.p1  ORF type:complete len:504 (-),score=30.71 TRINITY_DN17016_c0_g1_i1:507-2018(-)
MSRIPLFADLLPDQVSSSTSGRSSTGSSGSSSWDLVPAISASDGGSRRDSGNTFCTSSSTGARESCRFTDSHAPPLTLYRGVGSVQNPLHVQPDGQGNGGGTLGEGSYWTTSLAQAREYASRAGGQGDGVVYQLQLERSDVPGPRYMSATNDGLRPDWVCHRNRNLDDFPVASSMHHGDDEAPSRQFRFDAAAAAEVEDRGTVSQVSRGRSRSPRRSAPASGSHPADDADLSRQCSSDAAAAARPEDTGDVPQVSRDRSRSPRRSTSAAESHEENGNNSSRVFLDIYREGSGCTDPWGLKHSQSPITTGARVLSARAVSGAAEHFVSQWGREERRARAAVARGESDLGNGCKSSETFCSAEAAAWASNLGAGANAAAHVARASVEAPGIPGTNGLAAPNASAAFSQAQASASASVMGVSASAQADVLRADAGLAHTPLQAHVAILNAGASAAFSWENTGASIGTSLVEAEAGPFGVRAGVKVGARLMYGVPGVDAGPVSCCIQ